MLFRIIPISLTLLLVSAFSIVSYAYNDAKIYVQNKSNAIIMIGHKFIKIGTWDPAFSNCTINYGQPPLYARLKHGSGASKWSDGCFFIKADINGTWHNVCDVHIGSEDWGLSPQTYNFLSGHSHGFYCAVNPTSDGTDAKTYVTVENAN